MKTLHESINLIYRLVVTPDTPKEQLDFCMEMHARAHGLTRAEMLSAVRVKPFCGKPCKSRKGEIAAWRMLNGSRHVALYPKSNKLAWI